MNCMNCGAFLEDRSLDYCPQCGANVLIQRKADYLSKYYYNQGLEKSQIRDLSGAAVCLRQSLTYNKSNTSARNLLGLVYFETGEVVAALSEWVISKNLQPGKNLANDYIQRLQANQGRLDAINETIRKYNEALELARGKHDDMAVVRLRRVLSQNPKLIKGYHLLALLLMKQGEWAKARRILRKAATIDKTNTTTLRFLLEIDDQIGVSRKLPAAKKGFFVNRLQTAENDDVLSDLPESTAVSVTEPGRGSLFIALALGAAAGALAFWLLAVPAIRARIYREANRQIVKYSESVSSQGAQLSRVMGEAKESGDTAEAMAGQLVSEKHKSSSYQALFEAYLSLGQEDYDSAALAVQRVYEDTLNNDSLRAVYNMICQQTGVSGLTSDSSIPDEAYDAQMEAGTAAEPVYEEEYEDYAGEEDEEYTDDSEEEIYYEEDSWSEEDQGY